MNRLILGVVACVVVLMGCGVGYGEQDMGVTSQEQAILSGGAGGDPDDPPTLLTLAGLWANAGQPIGNITNVSVKVTTSGGSGPCAGVVNVFDGVKWLGGQEVTFTGSTLNVSIAALTTSTGYNPLSGSFAPVEYQPKEVHAVLWAAPGCAPKTLKAPVIKGTLRL